MLGVLGDLVEDIVVWLNEPIKSASDTDVSMYRTGGGSAANVARFAGRHYPTRFIGCIGSDAIGDALTANLEAHNVDVRVQRRGETGTILVLVDQQGERTMLPNRGASVLLSDVDSSLLEGLKHLHIPAYSFAVDPLASTSVELARQMRERDGTISIDASSTGMLQKYGKEAFLGLLRQLAPRLLLANRSEAEFLDVGRDDVFKQMTVVIKDGARPTTVLDKGAQPFDVAVPPVSHVRDLTGAGDAFASGFLIAFLRGSTLRVSCAAGHCAAATVLSNPGANEGTT